MTAAERPINTLETIASVGLVYFTASQRVHAPMVFIAVPMKDTIQFFLPRYNITGIAAGSTVLSCVRTDRGGEKGKDGGCTLGEGILNEGACKMYPRKAPGTKGYLSRTWALHNITSDAALTGDKARAIGPGDRLVTASAIGTQVECLLGDVWQCRKVHEHERISCRVA